jgi:hypothetical protein
MRFKILMTAFFLGCISLFSCQKDEDINPPVDPPSVTGDSIYLDKIFDIFDDGTGPDTSISVIRYDNRKRVISMDDSTSGVAGPSFYTLSYNGIDTLPSRSVFIDGPIGTPDQGTTTTFYTYDTQGRRTRDSVMEAFTYNSVPVLRKRIITYSYAPGKRYAQTYITDPTVGADIFPRRDTAYLDATGNVLSNKEYSDEGAGYVLRTTSLFTYDNHPSPFSRIPDEPLFYELEGHNNKLTQDQNDTFGNTHYENTYTYNAITGLPVFVNSISGGVAEKVVFTYKAL